MGGATPFVKAGIAGVSSVQQSNSDANSMESERNAAQYNANLDKIRAQLYFEQANQLEEQQRRKSASYLGSQRAALAESGVSFEGSAADVYKQSALNAEMDALNIRYQGQLQNYGAMSQAGLDQFKADIAESNRANIEKTKWTKAGMAAASAFFGSSGGMGGYGGGGGS